MAAVNSYAFHKMIDSSKLMSIKYFRRYIAVNNFKKEPVQKET